MIQSFLWEFNSSEMCVGMASPFKHILRGSDFPEEVQEASFRGFYTALAIFQIEPLFAHMAALPKSL
ncbi:hypothetical protein C9I89_09755 [Photobacterium lipolyticum]|uniref:Uncharacterized protein n=1 Tax=Photobacterium lipolyticum TaxID=266810 RepID=A0A2T3MZW2_9GAMM|nr:hypothetical protein C9I89_09755 [Photobacterium lipolyticum]